MEADDGMMRLGQATVAVNVRLTSSAVDVIQVADGILEDAVAKLAVEAGAPRLVRLNKPAFSKALYQVNLAASIGDEKEEGVRMYV